VFGRNEIGAEWTDAGSRRDRRYLKARTRRVAARALPLSPTRILRVHLDQLGTCQGRAHILRYPRRGTGVYHLPPGMELSAVYRAGSRWIRLTAGPAGLRRAPRLRLHMAQRRRCARQVAEWAGHSVAVLRRVYAKCIDGQDQVAKRRI
jgi:hypothetical protein